MELRHLRTFLAVAEELSFRRAATKLHVTQPALSRQIRDLEEELGVELLVRAPKGIALSPAGKAFLPEARKILELSAEAALSMRRFAECRQARLDVGYISPALGSFLAESLHVFSQRHAKVRVMLFELSPARQMEALRGGRLDIALIGHACPELATEFDLFAIRRFPLFAVLPDTHRLASALEADLHDLAGEAFVGLSEDSFPGHNAAVEEVCRKAGFAPQFRGGYADGLSSALAMVGSGQGICLMPEEVRELPHRHVRFLPLAPASFLEFSAALCAGERRPIVRTLLEEFRTNAKR